MPITSEMEVSIADVVCSQAKISLAPRFVTSKDDEGKEVKVLNVNFNNPYYVIPRYFKYLSYFNTVTENQTRILDESFDNILILNEFKDFVIPRTVRYIPSLYWSADLLKRTGVNGNGLDIDEFIKLSNHIRRWFKKDARSEVTSLSALKVNASLADVLANVAYKGRVSYNDKAFVPLEIYDACLGYLFEPDYFNTKADKVLEKYIDRMVF